MKLFGIFRIKSSLSKLLIAIIIKEQPKSKLKSLSKSLSSSGVGAYSRGLFRGEPIRGFMVHLSSLE